MVLLYLLLASPAWAVDADDSELTRKEPPMDWTRTAVTRSFGQIPEPGELDPVKMRALEAGQLSYFFGEYKRAFTSWKPLAEEGLADAQANLGWLYQAGLGVEKDIQKAYQWYTKAADQGQAVAQNNLGVLYEYGNGVEKDLARAKSLYEKSADQGYRFAQYNLAQLILNKDIKQRDEAVGWLKKAAAQGVVQAKDKLKSLGLAIDDKLTKQ